MVQTGDTSGLYGGCSTTSRPNSIKVSSVTLAVWRLALSWRRHNSLLSHPGIFFLNAGLRKFLKSSLKFFALILLLSTICSWFWWYHGVVKEHLSTLSYCARCGCSVFHFLTLHSTQTRLTRLCLESLVSFTVTHIFLAEKLIIILCWTITETHSLTVSPFTTQELP